MMVLSRAIRLALFISALCFASVAWAQENLDRGKSAAQLFASDCALCHKSPQGLAKAGGAVLVDFLRQHYSASRESATALAAYLQSAGRGPAAPAGAPKRTAKGDGAKGPEKKPATGKPGETKPDEAKSGESKSDSAKPDSAKPGNAKSGNAKSGDAKSGNTKSGNIKSTEPWPSGPKASEPWPGAVDVKASEPKPAEAAKPEKSD